MNSRTNTPLSYARALVAAVLWPRSSASRPHGAGDSGHFRQGGRPSGAGIGAANITIKSLETGATRT